MRNTYLPFFLCTLVLLPSLGHAEIITSMAIYEKEGKTTEKYPLTFALPFPEGKVKEGVIVKHKGAVIPAQFDIKRKWNDGSIKHGIVSVVIPVRANATETLTIETGTTNSNEGSLTVQQILERDVESVIAMTNMSGSGNPASASASLRTALTSKPLQYWMQGPICTEVLADAQITPNGNLHARWEVRLYPGTNYVRISNIVEQTNLSALGMTTYDVAITQGANNPKQVYQFQGHSHSYGSRWRKTFWLGQVPPEVELHYDTQYLASTMMIPNMDTNVSIPTAEIDKLHTTLKTKDGVSSSSPLGVRGGDDIDGAGNIYRGMTMVGGRDEIGLMPTWTAMYLLDYSSKLRELTLKNGDIAGQIGSMHYREGDPTKPFYGKPVVSIDARPKVQLWYPKDDMPAPLGDIPNDPNNWNPDRAHQPSLAYIPYLLTGEHYYMEEMMFWASFDLGYTLYARNGNGQVQKFSSHFPQGTAAGIIHDELRGVIWSLRNISDAANIIADSESAAISYFKEKLNNNLLWLYLGNSETSHGLHFIRVSREAMVPGDFSGEAPWQHDFAIVVLSDMARKKDAIENYAEFKRLFDRLGSFTVGRFTNHPDYNKWDGATYYLPLNNRKDGTYFVGETWRDFWNVCVELSTTKPSHFQVSADHISFPEARKNDPESYLYIAQAALAQLTHLPGGSDAYEFVRSNAKPEIYRMKPQWGALIPKGDIINAPYIINIQ
ncbi:MAG: hypothetical protein ACOX5Z_05965 [Desulfobulbus sp.]|jgi:hypothetical protein